MVASKIVLPKGGGSFDATEYKGIRGCGKGEISKVEKGREDEVIG
jgi:hypothetical protein